MADHATGASPAPVLVTTVGQPTPVHKVEEASLSIGDIAILLGIVVAIITVVGFFLNRGSQKRQEDQEAANERTATIMAAIQNAHDDSARDVRELSDKVKEGRTVIDKDIEAIRADRRHDKVNAETNVAAIKHLIDRNAEDIRNLDRRTTTLDEKTRNQDRAIEELKTILKEKMEETKELIRQQGETSTAQFKELATTIREMSSRKPLP